MLKSTHKPVVAPPLADGWTEHKAPTGHTYYYNAETKQSTYTRPVAASAPVGPSQTSTIPSGLSNDPSQSFLQYQSVGSSPGPSFNNLDPSRPYNDSRVHHDGGRNDREERNKQRDQRLQALDKPRSKQAIPGHEPWFLIHTKYGRRFVYNSAKNQSFWRIPDKLKDGILALDQQRIKEKADALAKERGIDHNREESNGAEDRNFGQPAGPAQEGADDSSEYEEVEVTDDEDEESAAKRPRTDEGADDTGQEGPVEFNEDDIAYQLAAMGQEYGLDPGEYDDGNMEEWEEGAQGLELTEEDATALFKDLLNDFGVNPYSSWDKIVEEGRLVDDTRYTALTSMKARKEVFEDWSRERIKQLREQRAKEEKKDPRIPYLAFLQQHATPKLYWPEFKRKYKKEPELRDTSLSDKDREKWYREHINRLKLPPTTLKSDFLTLLKSQPLSLLNNSTLPTNLPPIVLADIRYISLDPKVRDSLVETLISTLPPKPDEDIGEDDEEAIKERKDKERRQKALEERERKVAEEKRRQKRNLEAGRGRLREEEEEIARAMNVTKKGLKDHLVSEHQD